MSEHDEHIQSFKERELAAAALRRREREVLGGLSHLKTVEKVVHIMHAISNRSLPRDNKNERLIENGAF